MYIVFPAEKVRHAEIAKIKNMITLCSLHSVVFYVNIYRSI